MAKPQEITQQMKAMFMRLTIGQRIGLGALLVLLTGGIIVGSMIAGRPDWKLLAKGLSAVEAPKVMTKLEEAGINYDLSADQSSIMVDARDLKAARRALVGAGISGAVEVDDSENSLFKSSLSRNELAFSQARELEKRLSQKLMRFDFIEYAAVTISPALDKYFKQGRAEAKASVQVKPVSLLSVQQIESIAHVVAGGVERLSADQVAIVDATTGLTLRQPAGDASTGLRPPNFAYVQALERHKEDQAQQKLDMVYGPRKVVVSVAADIDWDRMETTETRYDPESGVTLEKESTTSTRVGESRIPGGRVGAGAAANGANGAGKGTESKDNTVRETKKFNHTATALIKAGGAVKRLTVGVFIDASLQADVEAIKSTIAAAIGVDKTRGDTIEVSTTTFAVPEKTNFEDERKSAESFDRIITWAEYGLVAILGLAFVFVALRTLKRARNTLREVMEQSIQAEEEARKERAPTLEETVLAAASKDTELAGRSLKRWLYETSQA